MSYPRVFYVACIALLLSFVFHNKVCKQETASESRIKGIEFEDAVIRNPGIYSLEPTFFKVSVQIEEGLLVIQILDLGDQVTLSFNRASVYHNWIIYWDEINRRLWLNSGDIGIRVWRFPLGGVPVHSTIEQEIKVPEVIANMALSAKDRN